MKINNGSLRANILTHNLIQARKDWDIKRKKKQQEVSLKREKMKLKQFELFT